MRFKGVQDLFAKSPAQATTEREDEEWYIENVFQFLAG